MVWFSPSGCDKNRAAFCHLSGLTSQNHRVFPAGSTQPLSGYGGGGGLVWAGVRHYLEPRLVDDVQEVLGVHGESVSCRQHLLLVVLLQTEKHKDELWFNIQTKSSNLILISSPLPTWSSHIVGLTSSSQSALPSQSSTVFVPSRSAKGDKSKQSDSVRKRK